MFKNVTLKNDKDVYIVKGYNEMFKDDLLHMGFKEVNMIVSMKDRELINYEAYVGGYEDLYYDLNGADVIAVVDKNFI